MSLTEISIVDLECLLDAVQRDRLSVPIDQASLVAAGFGRLLRSLDILEGLDARAVVAVLQSVLAERKRADLPKIEIVWTGPEAAVSRSRDTAIVLRELFASAERSVLIAGFRFDHGEELFSPLFERMRDHGVETTIFFDLPERARAGESLEACAHRWIDQFFARNWPFGSPRPHVYFDPRTAAPDLAASMHAKCVVIDGARALITSANFTDRGQTRNIELGVVIDSKGVASDVEAQWRGLIRDGLVMPYRG